MVTAHSPTAFSLPFVLPSGCFNLCLVLPQCPMGSHRARPFLSPSPYGSLNSALFLLPYSAVLRVSPVATGEPGLIVLIQVHKLSCWSQGSLPGIAHSLPKFTFPPCIPNFIVAFCREHGFNTSFTHRCFSWVGFGGTQLSPPLLVSCSSEWEVLKLSTESPIRRLILNLGHKWEFPTGLQPGLPSTPDVQPCDNVDGIARDSVFSPHGLLCADINWMIFMTFKSTYRRQDFKSAFIMRYLILTSLHFILISISTCPVKGLKCNSDESWGQGLWERVFWINFEKSDSRTCFMHTQHDRQASVYRTVFALVQPSW